MFTTSAFRQGLLVVFVAVLIAAACSNGNGTSLNVADTTATTTRAVDGPSTTDSGNDTTTSADGDDTATTIDDGHKRDEPVATQPIVDSGPVECLTEYVHAHLDVNDAHVQSEPASECHTHTCETPPHGPDITYSGDPWPCPEPVTTEAPTTTAAPVTTEVPTTTAAPVTTEAPTTTAAPVTTEAPTSTTTESVTPTPTEAPTSTTTEPVETIDGGAPVDLGRIDCPGGTIMGRFHSGQPTGCRLADGTVLCLTAPPNPVEPQLRLYNAAEWGVCPDFNPDRSPCPTSQTADHDYIDRWDYVFTSADQPPYVRPFWEHTVVLTPGLWFAELCVRNNEGSQIGTPEPQRVLVYLSPQPFCDGLGSLNTDVDRPKTYLSNGTVDLLRTNTGWIGNPLYRCTDRNGPYRYGIGLTVAGDWVLRIGKADLPFEVGTYNESTANLNDWVQQRYQEITGS